MPSMQLKTECRVLEELIDNYCGIANSNNMGKSRTDSDIALAIGELSTKNPTAKEDLKAILTREHCTDGMRAYVRISMEESWSLWLRRLATGGSISMSCGRNLMRTRQIGFGMWKLHSRRSGSDS